MEVANKRRFVYPSHLQHVAFRTRDVRYAVFKERAPHPGPAEAIGHSDALRFRETRLAAYSLKTKQRAISLCSGIARRESAAARIRSLVGPGRAPRRDFIRVRPGDDRAREHSTVHKNARSLETIARLLLFRKEVIQPHLPVRLPCYDFVPLTYHNFDALLLTVG